VYPRRLDSWVPVPFLLTIRAPASTTATKPTTAMRPMLKMPARQAVHGAQLPAAAVIVQNPSASRKRTAAILPCPFRQSSNPGRMRDRLCLGFIRRINNSSHRSGVVRIRPWAAQCESLYPAHGLFPGKSVPGVTGRSDRLLPGRARCPVLFSYRKRVQTICSWLPGKAPGRYH